jgi:S1-C subfamily serine protease
VSPPDFSQSLELAGGSAFDTEVEIAVVFSGESKRRPARILAVDNQEDDDIALIAITPYEGMPHLPQLTLNEPPPPPGTEVYLYGFPLGTYAMQEGDKVIASTLKGILSRRVGSFLQIDAGVHPGISGGPLTDASGRVLGIVCSVQQTPQGEIAPSIGYVLPIALAERVLALQKH